MRLKSCLLTGYCCLGLLLAGATMVRAQVKDIQVINHSPTLKISVTAVGLGLIGLELWWFLSKKS